MACFFHTFCGYFRFTQAEQQHSSKISILLHIDLVVSKIFCCLKICTHLLRWNFLSKFWRLNIFWTGFLCYKNNEKNNTFLVVLLAPKRLKFMAFFWCIICFCTNNASYIEKAGRKYFSVFISGTNLFQNATNLFRTQLLWKQLCLTKVCSTSYYNFPAINLFNQLNYKKQNKLKLDDNRQLIHKHFLYEEIPEPNWRYFLPNVSIIFITKEKTLIKTWILNLGFYLIPLKSILFFQQQQRIFILTCLICTLRSDLKDTL